jgi:hypothetical protein
VSDILAFTVWSLGQFPKTVVHIFGLSRSPGQSAAKAHQTSKLSLLDTFGDFSMPMPAVPDWLKARDGALKPGIREHILLVMLGGQPQYKLEVRPASGTFTCFVTQTVNGKRLDQGKSYPTSDAALTGGLAELQERLGW